MLKDENLNWGEKSSRAMVQSIQYLIKRYMNKYFQNEDENFLMGEFGVFRRFENF